MNAVKELTTDIISKNKSTPRNNRGKRENDLVERLRLFYQHSGVTSIGAIFTACLVTIVLFPTMDSWMILAWLGIIFLINIIRYSTATRFRMLSIIPERIRQITIMQSFIHGVAWGCLAIFVIINNDFTYQAFIISVVIGVAAIATATTSYLLSANVAFVLPALAPAAFALFINAENDIHYGLSILLTTATAILPFIASNIQHSFSNTLMLLSHNREHLNSLNSKFSKLRLEHKTLQKLNEKTRRLLESTNEGIIGVDIDGRCSFINPAGLSMLGYTQQEILSAEIHKLIFHTRVDGIVHLQEESPLFYAFRHGRSSLIDDDVMWQKNGNSFAAEYSVSPLFENSVISGAVIVFRDETNTRAMSRQLDYLASHDTLTGLHNRQAFEQKMRELLVETQIEGTRHVLCYLDLDQFKVINDTCGHMAGDALLRQLADLLKSNIRHSDFLARLGGDEFGLLLNGCSLTEAIPVVNGLVDTIRDFRFNWQTSIFAAGMSIGIVELNEETESSVTALSQADSACYIAKESGRNRFHIYRDNDFEIEKRKGEMEWVSHIHDAFEEKRFYLMKQNIKSTTGIQTGEYFEILIRMKGKDGGTISPGEFIPPAERYNLMPDIDRWVIRNTFNWMSQNPGQTDRISMCSINLSGQTVSDENFQNFVIECLESYQIPGEKICFEITETTAIANINQAIKLIKLLKQHGCRFALDDFGSGMSSFSYLKNLDVDFLKIDGNFVRDIINDHHNKAIVDAIHKVGQVMGIKTIAEFVENDEIRSELEDIGVDYVQGYKISQPVALNSGYQYLIPSR